MKIAIASGKGGTGKTTVAVNLYYTIARYYSPNISLVDCDVEEPNDALFFEDSRMVQEKSVELRVPEIDTEKCTFCRRCVSYCEFNAITVIPPLKHAEVSSDLCHACGACSHACEFDAITEHPHEIGKTTTYQLQFGNGLIEGRLNVGSTLQTPVIRFLKSQTENTDGIVIYDAPPGTSCSVVSTISDADFVILVTEPTPFGLYDLKLALGVVREMQKPFGVVINKAGLGNNELARFLENEEIPLLAEIPFSKEVAAHYADNRILAGVIEDYWEHFFLILDKILKIVNDDQ
jgi:MinD superfamily P-loop ATPase